MSHNATVEAAEDFAKSQPKGLYVLFATEFWERFSYYGMRAIFVLFLTKYLFLNKSTASNIYGTYTGLVYLTPLIGGYIADRYWGNRKSIFVGGILMALGQFLLFSCASVQPDTTASVVLLYAGLFFLIFGNGFFKPNISTMVGQLYPPNDARIDGAYSIFYMGINAGAFFAPLVCGYLGEDVDFKWGFLAAGVGMIIGLIVFYVLKNKYVVGPTGKQLGVKPNNVTKVIDEENKIAAEINTGGKSDASFTTKQWIFLLLGIVAVMALLHYGLHVDFWGSLIYGMTIVAPIFILSDQSLTKVEKSRLMVIVIVMIFVIFFWMCFEQAGASLTFFADEQTNRKIFGWTMPASYFQSFNALFIVLLAPLISMVWINLAKKGKNPSAPYKQALGLMFLALGFLWIAFGSKNIPAKGASMIFLTGLYLLHTIGELCLSPIGLSMVNKLTPLRFTSLMMGIWFLAIATGNKLAGTMSSLYPEQQTISQEYNAANVLMDGKAIDWSAVQNNRKVDNNHYWKINTIKTAANADSLTQILIETASTPISYDTVKANRIIPQPLSEQKLKNIARWGDKEPKYLFSLADNSNTYYLLVNEMAAKNNKITLQTWDLKPKPPKFLGIEITDLFTYFMIFVGLSGIASIVLFLIAGRLTKMMEGIK